MRFQDKRVVILGGTSGLGLATAKAAAAEGASVVIASSTAGRVEEALQQLPASAEGHAIDLLDEAAVGVFFGELGRFDHLVYTAGESLQLGLITETPVEAARRALELRVWGAYAAVKHAVPNIRPGGSIVLVSGSAGPRPHAGWTVSALICSGMEGFARALAVELAPLRVNIVRPGVIRTDLWNSMAEAEREALYETTGGNLPVGRVGEAPEIAAGFLFLMDNGYSTGSVVTLDGGTLLA
jgi:NAD(P)-dependent dehydrogenase (short-subunit alcohol dehydrogenase family)